jgi:cytochrome c-type biogenesis protein CcmH/NrfF
MRRGGVLVSGAARAWPGALRLAAFLAVLLAVQLGVAGLSGPAGAQAPSAAEVAAEADPKLDIEWAYALAHELMSPFCPGRTLAECSSPQAAELRLWILTQAAAGASREEIEANLYGRFGDVLRSTPKAEGWGLWAYLVPILFFVIGGPVVVWIIRRLAAGSGAVAERPAPAAAPAASASVTADLSDAELERLVDQELGRS